MNKLSWADIERRRLHINPEYVIPDDRQSLEEVIAELAPRKKPVQRYGLLWAKPRRFEWQLAWLIGASILIWLLAEPVGTLMGLLR